MNAPLAPQIFTKAITAQVLTLDRSHIAYELCGGRGYTLHRGTSNECASYVLRNPRGPRGGSVHVREAVA